MQYMQRCAVQLLPVVTSLIWRACPTHVFMHCPVVQPAVVWLQDLWARLVPGSRLPLDVRVLIAGDHTVWDPGGAAAG
jgi:hypothetical protein